MGKAGAHGPFVPGCVVASTAVTCTPQVSQRAKHVVGAAKTRTCYHQVIARLQ